MNGKKYLLMILTGVGLMGEHILVYGYFDFELLGHETYGMVLILVGLISFWYENLRIKKFVIDSKGMDDPEDV